MITLQIQWLKSVDPEVKTVMTETDSENNLRIAAGDTRQDTTGSKNIQSGESQ